MKKMIPKEIRSFLEDAMQITAEKFIPVVYSRENYNKIFGNGIIETPVETVKLGSSQFIKLCPANRNNLMLAIRRTLENPLIVLEKETFDEKSESFKPVHVYGKSFVNTTNNHTRTVESVIIYKEGENIAMSLHNKDISDFVQQIKTADDIIYLDKEVSRVTAFGINTGDSHVVKEVKELLSSSEHKSLPFNPVYDTNSVLSTEEFILDNDVEIGNLEITKDNFDKYFNIFSRHISYKDNPDKIASELFNYHVPESDREDMRNWLTKEGYSIKEKTKIQKMVFPTARKPDCINSVKQKSIMDSENIINARKEENTMAEGNVNQTEGSAKAEGKKAIDPNRLGYVIFRGNVKTFMNAVKDGSLPAFSMDGADASGKITMKPVAVRSFTKGQVFTGVNQLVAQKKAAELGLEPDASGSVRLITYRQAGEKNIRKGSPNFELTSYDKEKNSINYYHLYPMSAVIDPDKVSPGQAPETVPDAKISATDPNMSPKEYFAAYEAATKAGCQFETNRKTVEAVREKTIGMEKELSSNFKYNSFSAAIESGANNLLLSAAEATRSMEQTKDRNIQKEIQKSDNAIDIG